MPDREVLISIRPKYCELIANGEKAIEVRKTRPRITTPFKCYIYCTKDFYRKGDGYFQGKCCGKVIGEFVCDKIITVDCDSIAPFDYNTRDYINKESCLSRDDFVKYAGVKMTYGWHILNLVIYNEPKELSEFRHCGMNYHFNPIINKPPQSWCYVQKVSDND